MLVTLAALWMAGKLYLSSIKESSPVQIRQLELIDKVVTLVSVKDPLAYQAVQAMNTHYTEVYDPSEEAEALKEKLKENGDGFDDYEDDDLSDVYEAFR